MNKKCNSVSPWSSPVMVLNHFVGLSSIDTQTETSWCIRIMLLIRQFGTLYWQRISGIDELCMVWNAYRKSTKTSDAVMFVILQLWIAYHSVIASLVIDLPTRKPLWYWLSCWYIIGIRRLRKTLLDNLALEHYMRILADYQVQLDCLYFVSKRSRYSFNCQESCFQYSTLWCGYSAWPWTFPPARRSLELDSKNRLCRKVCYYARSVVLLEFLWL